MSASGTFVAPSIPGVELVNPEKMPSEFRKFKRDTLYFIEQIAFFPKEEMDKRIPHNTRKSVPRIVALTPFAVFITDQAGKMDRASKIDIVTELCWQASTIKKFIGTGTNGNVLMRLPEEYDILFSFENDDGAKKAQRFCEVFSKVAGARPGGKPTPVRAIDGGDKIEDQYSGDAPANYISPQQIMALNQLRRDFEQRVQACQEEYYSIEKNLIERRDVVGAKKAEHTALEGSVGSDIATLQKQLEAARKQVNAAQRKLTTVDVELAKAATDADTAKRQLVEERMNFEVLVKARVAAGDSPEVQEQVEMMNTLKRANTRELEKLNNTLAKAKAKFDRPNYEGAPAALASRAKELEDKLRLGVDRWERDTSADIRMHQKLEQEADDLAKLVLQLREVIDKKKKALEAKRPQPIVLPAAGAGAGGGGDATIGWDDDLLGGGGGPSPAPAGGGNAFDDDLLGGGGGGGGLAPSGVGAAASGGIDLLGDDSLLLGGGPAAAGGAAASGGVDLLGDDSLLGGGVPAPAPVVDGEELF